MQKLPTYNEVSNVLAKANVNVEASWVHGALCGFLCTETNINAKLRFEQFFFMIFQQNNFPQHNNQILIDLYEVSLQGLGDNDFDFNLLLPADDAIFSYRAEALRDWCEGFLAGLAHAKVSIKKILSADSQEGLHHLSEIAKLDYENIDVKEEDEKAFFEVAEYVRIVVMMIYTDMLTNQESTTIMH